MRRDLLWQRLWAIKGTRGGDAMVESGPMPAMVARAIAGSAARVRARAGDCDPHNHPLVAYHRGAVVVPVRVLAGDSPVILHEQVHGIRQRNDLHVALDLDPLAEEVVGEDTQRSLRRRPQVPRLQ